MTKSKKEKPIIFTEKIARDFINSQQTKTCLSLSCPERFSVCCGAKSKLENLIRQLLQSEHKELLDKITLLIAEECNICRQENQPTSRLTSLAVKISKLK